MTQPLRMIDTFSGIGGFSLAARWLGGIETVQFVEREPYCQRILRKHWPTVPIHDDICTFNPEVGSADIVCGGFPCQDISQAGKGAGLAGSRSGLFYELIRIIRLVRPRYIILENVAAILARGLDDVLGTLAQAGYDTEWACIPAAAVGACHQRDRWWAVAYPAGEQRNDLRVARSGRQAESELGDGDGTDVAYAQSGRNVRHDQQAGQQIQPVDMGKAGVRSATPAPMCQRLEGPNQLGSSGAQWPAAIARLSPDWRSYLSEPVLCRGDDGLSGRVDRLKALGNAVVPQVAMLPLARVLEIQRQITSDAPAPPTQCQGHQPPSVAASSSGCT